MDQPWNANIHYDALLDAMVPLGTQCVLDVGCGDGLLAARLARRIPYVTAVDIDAPVLRRAQTRFANAPIRWLHADIMTAELPTRASTPWSPMPPCTTSRTLGRR